MSVDLRHFEDPYWFSRGHAPRPPPRHNAKRQVVWPRDKKQKGAHTWSRWKDVFSGKGPDMWVTKQGDDGPHRDTWTQWGYGDIYGRFDNLGYRYHLDGGVDGPQSWPLGSRSTDEKYDFRTRRYKRPSYKDWSDVKWDRKGRYPLYYRNGYGDSHVPAHVLARQAWGEWRRGLHPFRHNPETVHWDWYFDEMPLYWGPRLY